MAHLDLRTATIEDVPAITEIYRPAVIFGTASFELDPPSEEEMRRRYEAITGGGFPYFVAEQAGVVVGYGFANAFRPPPAKGIGRDLLEALIVACTALGFRQMIAVIGDWGQQASIGLHRSLGFTFCGTVHSVGYKHGRWLDSVIMQRPLGEGDRTPPSDNATGTE